MATVEEVLTNQLERLWKLVEAQQATIAAFAGEFSEEEEYDDSDSHSGLPGA